MRGQRRRDELLHDEFEVFALADELFLAAVLEPHHRAAHAVLIHEGQDVLQILAMMQVEELRRALGIVARQRMGGDVVDLLVADPHDAAVVERVQILLAGAQHWRSSRQFARLDHVLWRWRLFSLGYPECGTSTINLRICVLFLAIINEPDLHHLRVLDVLLREHSLTRAARRTQCHPAGVE